MNDVVGKVMAIAVAEGRRTARDRTALFFILLLPVFIILLIGIAIGGGADRVPIGVVKQDSGALANELRDEFVRSPRLRVQKYSDVEAMRTAVRHSEVVAGVVIPPGYDAGLRAGPPAGVEFVTDPSGQASLAARGPVAAGVDKQASAAGAARLAVATAGVSFDAALSTARSLASAGGVTVDVSTANGRAPLPLGFSYTAPSNLVLFVFITSLAAAALLVNARRLGVTRRMLATPTPASVVLLGQSASRFLTAVFQGVFILVLGRLVFGVEWGDPLAAALLVLVFALAATGAALLMGTVARTEDQAGAIGPAIGIALGMLGGCMWPLVIVPPVMRAIGHGTPHAWAMDGFIALISRNAHIGDVAGDLLALAVFAALLLAAGTWRLRRLAYA
jgi:ABC-2 type transport system permease protein